MVEPAVVMGVGLVGPNARSADELWAALCEGRSLICTVPDLDGLPVDIAGVAPSVEDQLGFRGRSMDRYTQLAVVAARSAARSAGLQGRIPSERIAVVVGTGAGGISTVDAAADTIHAGAVRSISPYTLPMVLPNAAAAAVSRDLEAGGPSLGLSTACSAGADAIVEGMRLLACGEADAVVCGGSEAALTRLSILGFHKLGALSPLLESPDRTSRPFDEGRHGFVIAEGAAFVILERQPPEQGTPFGTVAGYAQTSDAFHIAAPRKDGLAIERAMRSALDAAHLEPSEIVAIKAHGTGTLLNDPIEADALVRVFGAPTPLVTSMKGCIGHTLGASGAMELILGLRIAASGVVPPTANLERPDPDFPPGLSLAMAAPMHVSPGPVLCNSFGFGGHNTAIVVTAEGL